MKVQGWRDCDCDAGSPRNKEMLGVGDEKVGPSFGTENLQTQKFLNGFPWIFLGFLDFPLDSLGFSQFGSLWIPGFSRPWKNLSIRAWRGQCGCPEQEWLHSSPGSFSWRAHTGVQGLKPAELGISFDPFFFGDQQIAVDGMISHSYKVKVLSHFLHSKSPLQVEFQSLGFLLPVSWELLGIDHLQWGMSNLHRCLRHGSHPRCLVFIRTLQAPSVRSEVRRHCWNMGQMPMMVVIRPARDFVLPECVSKKEDTTAAFWVTWGMVKVWYPTLCERAVNFYAFELLCCEFCAEATNLPFVLDSIWR